MISAVCKLSLVGPCSMGDCLSLLKEKLNKAILDGNSTGRRAMLSQHFDDAIALSERLLEVRFMNDIILSSVVLLNICNFC